MWGKLIYNGSCIFKGLFVFPFLGVGVLDIREEGLRGVKYVKIVSCDWENMDKKSRSDQHGLLLLVIVFNNQTNI